jgi:hypothetical protein
VGECFRQEFQRDEAAEVQVFRFVDHPHPAAAQQINDAVMRDDLARRSDVFCRIAW